MVKNGKVQTIAMLMVVGLLGWAPSTATAATRIDGQVQVGGGPVAKSMVTLWAASAGAPARLAQTQPGADGRFVISVDPSPSSDPPLYLVAVGGEPAGAKPPGNNAALAL